jgi:hypothetical protein
MLERGLSVVESRGPKAVQQVYFDKLKGAFRLSRAICFHCSGKALLTQVEPV